MAQTKREFIKATFIAESSNAINMAGIKEQVNRIVLIDKKTMREVLDAGFYMAGGRNAQTVYCSIWVHTKDGKEHSGHGKAGGGGYHKESAALADAIAYAAGYRDCISA